MAGSSNFQMWNPNQSNQESDSQYTADSLRTGGATSGALCPSPTFNKFAYQVAVAIWALNSSLAAKGFACSDSNPNALATVYSNLITTADQRPDLVQIPYSPNLQFNCAESNGFQVTLTGNVTSLSIVNASFGQVPINIVFTQGGGGGFTVAWPSNVKGAGTIDPGAGNNSVQSFIVLADGNLHAYTPMAVS